MSDDGAGPAAFRVEIVAAETCHVVTLRGELDVATTSRLRQALDGLIVDGAQCAVVDLSGLTFMDSSGLGALLAAHRKMRVLHGTIAVVAAAESSIARTISLTGLHHVLRMFPTVDDAMASLGASDRGQDQAGSS